MGGVPRPAPLVRYVLLYPAVALALLYGVGTALSIRYGNLLFGLTLVVGLLWAFHLGTGSGATTAEDGGLFVRRSHTRTGNPGGAQGPVGRPAAVLLTITIATIGGWVVLLGVTSA